MPYPDALNQNTTRDEMGSLRAAIDRVDEEIVRLLDRRARLARRIGEIKQENGLEAYAPARERAVLNRVTASSAGDFPRRGLEAVFREIISSSISLESRLKVAYLGPEATFTHEATLRSFGTSVELEPQATVAEVFTRVERGEAEHGVVGDAAWEPVTASRQAGDDDVVGFEALRAVYGPERHLEVRPAPARKNVTLVAIAAEHVDGDRPVTCWGAR
jgi:chorismate mutase